MSIKGMDSIVDNMEMLPTQVKERILKMLNKKGSAYELDEEGVVVKTLSKCTLTS